jgi:hypothetical protein
MERAPFRGNERMQQILGEAAEALRLTPEDALAAAVQEHEDLYRSADDERS